MERGWEWSPEVSLSVVPRTVPDCQLSTAHPIPRVSGLLTPGPQEASPVSAWLP